MKDRAPEPIEKIEPQVDFPVVGVGASAGGLEAVTEMFRHAPADPAMAFVLVQHLDPNHESMMAELIGRKTRLTVRQIRDGDPLQQGTIHIIPPGRSLSIEDGRLRLGTFSEPRGLRRPIDTFFASLANSQGPLAACVVVSGTGADGSTGLREVKNAGGVCVAQEPEEARYDDMPLSAQATGMVDYVLPAGEILNNICAFFDRREAINRGGEPGDVADSLEEISAVLRDAVGHDFGGYKPSTMIRRIERRMRVMEFREPREYVDFLRTNEVECDALFQDLLINVTGFFRDPEYFAMLNDRVIEPMVASMSSGDELRVWVPGCSSGQEAYTIAMLIDQVYATRQQPPLVQIFATDIDEKMIGVARQGRYSTSALSDIPEALRDTYTQGLDGSFQMVPRIRDMVRFSIHSIIKDPPFSRLDLISCRNMLIYMGENIQASLIPLMHYSLRPGGFLFLGPSESIGQRDDLFSPVDQKARIFKRKDAPRTYPLNLPIGADIGGRPRKGFRVAAEPGLEPDSGLGPADTIVMERFAPAFVRVDSEGEILSSFGDVAAYLHAAPGRGRQHIGHLARPGIREVVSQFIAKAHEDGRRTAIRDVEVVSRFGSQSIDLVAEPLTDGTIAVVFVDTGRFRQNLQDYYTDNTEIDDRIEKLEEQLRVTRVRLRGTVEELETANEELKSSNEEMMSMNEELQSANEELSTINEELKNKVDELAMMNDDMSNFVASTQIALVVVDDKMRVRVFTDALRDLIMLQETDRGRPLGELRSNLTDNILPEVARVIDDRVTIERMVHTDGGARSFLMRIMPYQSDRLSAGATLTFNDLTDYLALEEEIQLKNERLGLALSASEMGVWEHDLNTGEVIADERVRALFGIPVGEEASYTTLMGRIHPEDHDRIEVDFGRTVETGAPFEGQFRIVDADGSVRWIKGIGAVLESSNGEKRVVGLNYDITPEEEAREGQELLIREMNHRVKNLFAVISGLIGTSARQMTEVPEFSKVLRERVNALGRAYELTQSKGLDAAVDIRDLLLSVVRPHGEAEQIELDGPDVSVPVDMLTPLSLIFHEMATNAAKYGGLSEFGENVRIKWTVDANNFLKFSWNETASIPISARGAAPGFGTRLVDSSVRQLSGTVDRRWNNDGFSAEFKFGPI